jgi:hypothetical protein
VGLRFNRRVGIIPGVRLNFSKSGASVSLGGRGVHITIGRKGVRETVGLPGTGLYWTEQQPWRSGQPPVAPSGPSPFLPNTATPQRRRWGWLVWVGVALALAFIMHAGHAFH